MMITLFISEIKLAQEAKKFSGNLAIEPLAQESDPEKELYSHSHALVVLNKSKRAVRWRNIFMILCFSKFSGSEQR